MLCIPFLPSEHPVLACRTCWIVMVYIQIFLVSVLSPSQLSAFGPAVYSEQGYRATRSISWSRLSCNNKSPLGLYFFLFSPLSLKRTCSHSWASGLSVHAWSLSLASDRPVWVELFLPAFSLPRWQSTSFAGNQTGDSWVRDRRLYYSWE